MYGALNVCFIECRLHSYPLDELAKLRSVNCRLAKECEINIPETRCVDSSHETVQVLASSSIIEVRESGKNNPGTRWWVQTDIVSAGR